MHRELMKGMRANIPLAISAMAYGGVFGVISGNQGVSWAVTIAAHRNGGTTPSFLFGGGLLLVCAWSTATLSGNLLGGQIVAPENWGLDFAFVAVFAALTMSLWQGKEDLLPWLAAAGLAIIGEKLLPGKLYIALGGFGGGLVALLMELRQPAGKNGADNDSVEMLLPGKGEKQ